MRKTAWIVTCWGREGEEVVLLPNPMNYFDLMSTIKELYGENEVKNIIADTNFIKVRNYMVFEAKSTLVPLVEFKRIGIA